MAPTTTDAKAVIRTGSKQYLVSSGTIISVEKLDAAIGDTITLTDVVFLATGNGPASAAELSKAQVTAEVIEQGKGKKIRVFTYKSKKRQRRTIGHRQPFSKLRITGIGQRTAEKS